MRSGYRRLIPTALIIAACSSSTAAPTGTLVVSVSGLPSGPASILVTGPSGYSQTVTATTTLSNLAAGAYTVTASNVVIATSVYKPTPSVTGVQLTTTTLTAPVTYAIATGSLTITVAGLPGGTNAAIVVTGPNAFTQSVTGTTTLNTLVPGSYTITASSVTSSLTTYAPVPGSQPSTVVASVTPSTATVTYSVAPTVDLTIDGMYITQSSQNYLGTIPLVKDRAGYLRVFVKANTANTATPKVRVRWYSSGTLIRTDTIPAPTGSAPQVISEGVLNSSWNLAIPKTLIQPNLSVLADVDPGNLITETVETNNSFPFNGVPLALSVHTENVFTVTLVPVKMNAPAPDSGTGNVTAGNQDSYLTFLQKIHPVPSYTITPHAKYLTTTTDSLQSLDGNLAWDAVLLEIATLRSVESAPASQYYYGVVHPNYPGGVAGLGYVGAPAAIGWDRGINDQILAHEVGHNWGRYHAPCGGPSQVDPSWPTDPAHANALIGVYGFDLATTALKDKAVFTDVMSYCQSNQWISDYTYTGVMTYRETNPDVAPDAAGSAVEPVLLVWGRMHGNTLVLEPAFEISSTPSMPEGRGAYTIEGLDASGASLFSHAFAGVEVADAPRPSRSFVFKIPLRNFDPSRLSTLRLRGPGSEVRVAGGAAVAAMNVGRAPASQLIAKLRGRFAHVTWDHATYPMAMVRDARTGQVLSFARNGSVDVEATGDLVVVLSNGVRSVTETIKAQ